MMSDGAGSTLDYHTALGIANAAARTMAAMGRKFRVDVDVVALAAKAALGCDRDEAYRQMVKVFERNLAGPDVIDATGWAEAAFEPKMIRFEGNSPLTAWEQLCRIGQ
jgi:hypothetical protein